MCEHRLIIFLIFTSILFTIINGKIISSGNYDQQLLKDPSMKNHDIDGFGFKGISRIVSSSIPITDCIFTTSETGKFTYNMNNDDDDQTVCGVFFFTEPDKIVELDFLSFDVSCQHGGLVSVVDGWEMNGQVFPSEFDHPLPINDRFVEFCNKPVSRTFISSQNAALIQYRIPKKGNGFTVFVRHRKNPTPCNILVNSGTDAYTLRNYEGRVNCTLQAIFPSAVRVLTLDVGSRKILSSNHQVETGTSHNCNTAGLSDLVQIGGNSGLDTSKIEILESICGLNSKPDMSSKIIACEATSIRLVSSGLFDNSVTVIVRQALENEIMQANIFCGL